MTGTFLNVGAVLAGTLVGTLVGSRLPAGIRQRVLAGLGLITLVIGVDSALAWNDTNPLYVLGGVLLGGIAGEVIGIERRLEMLGDRIQRAVSQGGQREERSPVGAGGATEGPVSYTHLTLPTICSV